MCTQHGEMKVQMHEFLTLAQEICCHILRPNNYHIRERTPCIQWKEGRLWPAEYLYAVQEIKVSLSWQESKPESAVAHSVV